MPYKATVVRVTQLGALGRTFPHRRKVLPGHGRRHNRGLILHQLLRYGPQSRADLARATQLTAATVGQFVTDLLDEGIVEERGRRSTGMGKPGTLLHVVADARTVVCLDLSDQSRFVGGVVNLVGDVGQRRTVARRGRTGDAAVRLVAELTNTLLSQTTGPVIGIGIGSPGVVFADGVVQDASNLRWHDTPLADAVRGALDVPADVHVELPVRLLPVHIVNDANAAVLGERQFGDATTSNLLLVKIGLGVGAGLVLDGHLIEGDGSAAGEIGHVVVDPSGDPCACGNRGCLETVVAGSVLQQRLDGLDDAARDAVLAAAGDRLGSALAPVVSMLNLSEVLLSGPADLLGEPFRRALVAAVTQRTFPLVATRFDARRTSTGNDDVLLGAAAVVLEQELGVR
jgi:predicted NBD/HSP70 family sugar kinase